MYMFMVFMMKQDFFVKQMPLIKDNNLVTRNAHVQYESSNIYYLEVMTNVN